MTMEKDITSSVAVKFGVNIDVYKIFKETIQHRKFIKRTMSKNIKIATIFRDDFELSFKKLLNEKWTWLIISLPPVEFDHLVKKDIPSPNSDESSETGVIKCYLVPETYLYINLGRKDPTSKNTRNSKTLGKGISGGIIFIDSDTKVEKETEQQAERSFHWLMILLNNSTKYKLHFEVPRDCDIAYDALEASIERCKMSGSSCMETSYKEMHQVRAILHNELYNLFSEELTNSEWNIFFVSLENDESTGYMHLLFFKGKINSEGITFVKGINQGRVCIDHDTVITTPPGPANILHIETGGETFQIQFENVKGCKEILECVEQFKQQYTSSDSDSSSPSDSPPIIATAHVRIMDLGHSSPE